MSRAAARGGFTLPEAIIALTISSVLVLLVGSVFLVQNDFYSHVFLRSQVQENARATTELVASELRSVPGGGFIVADSGRMVFRSPMAMALVCGSIGNHVVAHIPGGAAGMDTTDVGGFGWLDPSTGQWRYYDRTWAQLRRDRAATLCYQNGADTTGISSEFVRLAYVDNDTGESVSDLLGATLLFFRKTEFRFGASQLVSGDRALYWGVYGRTLRELVTGVSPDAHFEFRTNGTTWSRWVGGGSLPSIDAVRVDVRSMGRGETSRQLTYDFGITVDIPLPNAL